MSRDTQFAGFARLLWDTLPDVPNDPLQVKAYDDWCEACELIITQRAYDLVCHAVHELDRLRAFSYGYRDEVGSTPQQMIKGVPDMTELPEVQNGSS